MSFEWKDWEYWIAATQLVFAMVGMGATLTLGQFRDIVRRPHSVAFVFLFQYVLCPLLALGLSYAFQLSPGLTLGMLIVSAMPSGAMSNIFTYLGRGNVPLSITATTASTLGCLVLTPLVLHVLEPQGLPGDFHMPAGRILREITFCLLVPLTIGMAIGYCRPSWRRPVSKWGVRGCLFFLSILVIGSLNSGQIEIFEHGWSAPIAFFLFGAILLGPVQVLAILLGFSEDDAYTMGIEITMRNCNVALLLKASLFPVIAAGVVDPIGEGVLYASLFYGGMCLFLCMLPIIRRWIVWRIRVRRNKDSTMPQSADQSHNDDGPMQVSSVA